MYMLGASGGGAMGMKALSKIFIYEQTTVCVVESTLLVLIKHRSHVRFDKTNIIIPAH